MKSKRGVTVNFNCPESGLLLWAKWNGLKNICDNSKNCSNLNCAYYGRGG